MATIIKLLSLQLALSLYLLGQGRSDDYECRGVPGEITIGQAMTGKLVKGKPEWTVTFSNPCYCNQLHISVTCAGFKTVEKINPRALAIAGDGKCLLADDGAIHPHDSFSFNYAWDRPYPFKIADAIVACS
ncbi:TPD1 protein homolog 1-like [Diospyros lotus]|uniref:TPD1 protein homolog 1-like n=1 Tax=Diospyros lotus TaxID=55363 RepID=UPI002253E76E|nr:TPD1 protein homolog 1-like [Diospyros lotus]